MPVREFKDEGGREWRAWDIKPHEIHPVTKAEDYLADCYVTGWIVFETFSGDEKRRLCPWPINWMDESEQGLRKLLSMAEIVPASKSQRVSGEWGGDEAHAVASAIAASEQPDLTDLQVVRTFRYPGGRFWIVSVLRHPEDGGPPVLRFTAGARTIDVRKWRKDWADQPDEMLVTMLRRAAPRRESGQPGLGTPRRRWDDDQPQARA